MSTCMKGVCKCFSFFFKKKPSGLRLPIIRLLSQGKACHCIFEISVGRLNFDPNLISPIIIIADVTPAFLLYCSTSPPEDKAGLCKSRFYRFRPRVKLQKRIESDLVGSWWEQEPFIMRKVLLVLLVIAVVLLVTAECRRHPKRGGKKPGGGKGKGGKVTRPNKKGEHNAIHWTKFL